MIRKKQGDCQMRTEQIMQFLILPGATVVEAMKKIDSNARGILFITNNEKKLLGVVTDGDIRRWLIKTGDLQGCVDSIMNREPRTIYGKDVAGAKEFMQKK